MLTRRHLMAAGAAGAMAGLIGRGRADTIKLTFCSWGGALSDLEKTALLDHLQECADCAARLGTPAEIEIE